MVGSKETEAPPAAPAGPYEPGKLERMKDSVRNLLVGIGEDPTREGLLDTPKVSETHRRRPSLISPFPLPPHSQTPL
jgi:hypothetical protein